MFQPFALQRLQQIETDIEREQAQKNPDSERLAVLEDAATAFDNLILNIQPDDELVADPGRLDYPVVKVSWYDAVEYCVWKSQQAGLDSCYGTLDDVMRARQKTRSLRLDISKNGYRLPVSAEWEIACRGGATTPWFFGSHESFADRYANSISNSEAMIAPVGMLRPNAIGLFDMAGNVAEWMTNPARSQIDGAIVAIAELARLTDQDLNGEIRGGSFMDRVEKLRSGVRAYRGRDGGSEVIGFRMARTLPNKASSIDIEK